MYDLPSHAKCLQQLQVALFSTLLCCCSGLGSLGTASTVSKKHRSAGLLVARGTHEKSATLDSQGAASLSEGSKVQPRQRTKDWVRATAQYFLHDADGMTFSEMMPIGSTGGNIRCDGQEHCQFQTFEEATAFCSNNMTCNGILQQTENAESGCVGGLGCFYPALGLLQFDIQWRRQHGKTYERQLLAYNRFQDGRKLNRLYTAGTRSCEGVNYCQFPTLGPSLDFCDLDAECLGVLQLPAASYGKGCKGGKGCFVPAKGAILHDPLWLTMSGETYLKEQEVAYTLHEEDGKVFSGRFVTGTAGCRGVHNCQFKTLVAAEAFCNADPTCTGITEKPTEPGAEEGCNGGLGCFEPSRGTLKFDEMFLVTEGRIYERRLVR